MKQDTKRALVEAGLDLLITQGYHKTGIKEVLDKVGVPKGSFYHYFESKDAFGHELLNHYSTAQLSYMEQVLSDPARSPLDRMKKLFGDLLQHYEEMNYWGGCFLGNMSQEMGNVSEAFEDHCAQEFERWRVPFAACIREAQARQEIAEALDAEALADFILNSWEGALLRMKVMRSTQPLQLCVKMLFETCLAVR